MDRQIDIDLPGDPGSSRLHISSDWLGQLVQTEPARSVIDTHNLITQALEQPVGSLRIEELVKPLQKVAIIVDDITRHTPSALALSPLIHRLKLAGISLQDISIVVALGSHRLMNDLEIEKKLGRQVMQECRVIQSNWADEEDMVDLGQSADNIPAFVHRQVVEADIKIALGMITPHMDAGFSGGAKMILPGVCGKRTVEEFHVFSALEPGNPLGNPQARSRLALEQFVREHNLLNFIVNFVLTPADEIFACVTGDPVAAHRRGVAIARLVYGVQVPKRYPIVVANCSPYQQDLWQSCKGLWCGDLLTADGGTLIWVTSAPEGYRNYPALPRSIGIPKTTLQQLLRDDLDDDPLEAATGLMIGRMKERIRIVLVSLGLDDRDAAQMGLPYFSHVGTAIAQAVNSLPPGEHPGCVAVVPQAGIVLPILAEESIC